MKSGTFNNRDCYLAVSPTFWNWALSEKEAGSVSSVGADAPGACTDTASRLKNNLHNYKLLVGVLSFAWHLA